MRVLEILAKGYSRQQVPQVCIAPRTKRFKKLCLMLLFTAIFMLFLPVTVNAASLEDMYEEQLASSGADELWDKLPPSTRALLRELGIDKLNASSFTDWDPESVSNSMLDLLVDQASGPLRTLGVLFGVVLVYALMDGIRESVKEETISKVFGVICALTSCAALLVPLSGSIGRVRDAAESTSVFMLSYVPVYGGVLLASGQIASAASYQSVVLFCAEIISYIATNWIVPLMTVSLALGLTGSVTTGYKLDAASTLINKSCSWGLGISMTLFTGLLTLQSLVGAAADSLTGRAIRFSVNSFVPVVGGALSEAFNTVKGCLHLLKSTLGGFGILVIALIVLPPLLECILWLFTLSICTMTAEMFSLDSVAALFKASQGVIKTLIAVLAACSMFMIIATTVVTLAGTNT